MQNANIRLEMHMIHIHLFWESEQAQGNVNIISKGCVLWEKYVLIFDLFGCDDCLHFRFPFLYAPMNFWHHSQMRELVAVDKSPYLTIWSN